MFWRDFILKKRGPSVAPLVPGIGGAIAFVLSQLPVLSEYFWLPLLLDVGCVPYLILALVNLVIEGWSFSGFNLLRRYVAENDGRRKVVLELYRRKFLMRQNIKRARGECGFAFISRVGDWAEMEDQVLLKLNGEQMIFSRKGDDLIQQQCCSSPDGNPDTSLAGLTFRRIK